MANNGVDIELTFTANAEGISDAVHKNVNKIVKDFQSISNAASGMDLNSKMQKSLNDLTKSYSLLPTYVKNYDGALKEAAKNTSEYFKAESQYGKENFKLSQDRYSLLKEQADLKNKLDPSYRVNKGSDANIEKTKSALNGVNSELAQTKAQMDAITQKRDQAFNMVKNLSMAIKSVPADKQNNASLKKFEIPGVEGVKLRYKELVQEQAKAKAQLQDYTAQLKPLEAEYSRLSAEQSKYTTKLANLTKQVRPNAKVLETYRAKLAEVTQALAENQAKQDALKPPNEKDFIKFVNPDTQGYDAVTKTLEKLVPLLNLGSKASKTFNEELEKNSGASKFADSMSGVKTISKQLHSILNGIKNTAQKAGKLLQNTFAGLKGTLKACINPLGTIWGYIRKITSGGTAGAKSLRKSMQQGLKNLIQYGLGFRSIYFLVKRLRNETVESFKEMAANVPEVNTQISSMLQSINNVRANVATMFQPLLTVVAPLVEKFANYVISVFNSIARFIATITGQGYIYKATAAWKDYAKSLDKTSKSAKNATTSLDELNIISQEKDSGSGAGDYDAAYEKEMLDAPNLWAKLLMEGLEDWDLTELGNAIGQKIIAALMSIDWVKIKQAAYNLGKGLATLINGVVESELGGVRFGQVIGRTIGEAINTAIAFAYSWIYHLHWISIGQAIADCLNTAIETIDWSRLGKVLGGFIEGVVLMTRTWLKATNWRKLGESIRTFISNAIKSINIDDVIGLFGDLMTAISEFLGGLFDTASPNIASFIATVAGLILTLEALKVAMDITIAITTFVQGFGAALAALGAFQPVLIAVMGAIAAIGVAVTMVMSEAAAQTVHHNEVIASMGEAYNQLRTDVSNTALSIDQTIDRIEELGRTYQQTLETIEFNSVYVDNLITRFEELSQKTDLTTGEQLEMQTISEALCGIYPELNGLIDEETGLINASADALREKCAKLKEELELEAKKEYYKELYYNYIQANEQLKDAKDEVQRATETEANSEAEYQKLLTELTALEEKYGKSLENKMGIEVEHANGVKTTYNNYGELMQAIADAKTKQDDMAKTTEQATKNYADMAESTIKVAQNLDDLGSSMDIATTYVAESTDLINQDLIDLGSESQLALEENAPLVEAGTVAMFEPLDTKLKGIEEEASISGGHFVSNYGRALNDGIPLVKTAADGIATTIADLLKHTTPKSGPLSDDDVWGAHFIDNLSKAIEKQIPVALKPAIQKVTDEFVAFKDNLLNNILPAIANGFVNTGNVVAAAVETAANAAIDGINAALEAIRALDFIIPDWVPDFGGMEFAVMVPDSIGHIAIPRVPALANGAVIPPNNQFLALLGDQTHGTNIEAPLTTIQDAVALVLQPYLERLISNTDDLIESNERIADKELQIGDRDIARANIRGMKSLGRVIKTS